MNDDELLMEMYRLRHRMDVIISKLEFKRNYITGCEDRTKTSTKTYDDCTTKTYNGDNYYD